METLKLKVKKIGNSKVKKGILLKSNNDVPRKGWAKAFKRMAKNGDDKLLMPDIFEDENFAKWK